MRIRKDEMGIWRSLQSWLSWLPWYRRQARDADLERELRDHLELEADEHRAAGLPPQQAAYAAHRALGNTLKIEEDVRATWGFQWLETLVQDVRYGLRQLRRSPGFTAVAILTLALGIGANSAVFSAIDAILLRPLPFPAGDQLMSLHQYDSKAKNPASFVAPVRLEDWNRLNTTFQAISGYYTQEISEISGTLPEKVTEALVAPRFLQVWGVSPALGRDFAPEEEHFGGPSAVLISERFWRHRFHADPKAIGKTLRLEKHTFTIVGMMPASFLFPDHDVDLWSPSPPDGPAAQSREST